MDSNYEIQPILNSPYTVACLDRGLNYLSDLFSILKSLPYLRISDPVQPVLVLLENRGTCSSKHAFVKYLAMEQAWLKVKLLLVMYKMNGANTPGIGSALNLHRLTYLPEAHMVIELDGKVFDLTSPRSDFVSLRNDLLSIIEIQPNQSGAWKKSYHQKWLNNWISENNIPLTPDQLWKIREECISNLQA